MSVYRPSAEELNAYVDGELAASEAARVAGAVATDPKIASQVAALSQLKSAVGDVVSEAPAIDLPAPRSPRWRGVAAAAAAIVVLAAGIAAMFLPQTPSPGADWLDRGRATHVRWADRASPDDRAHSAAYLPVVARMGADAFVPDLSAARLSVARVQAVALSGGPDQALHVGYVGTRGCRVSLWIMPAPADLPTAFTRYRRDGDTAYGWRVGSMAYAMFAADMVSGRFDLIARATHAATRVLAAPDPDMRVALRRSRETSPPCTV